MYVSNSQVPGVIQFESGSHLDLLKLLQVFFKACKGLASYQELVPRGSPVIFQKAGNNVSVALK